MGLRKSSSSKTHKKIKGVGGWEGGKGWGRGGNLNDTIIFLFKIKTKYLKN